MRVKLLTVGNLVALVALLYLAALIGASILFWSKPDAPHLQTEHRHRCSTCPNDEAGR